MDYNSTLNLPKTEFPMRAGLPKREPGMLEQWREKDIYGGVLKKNEGKPNFVLHDGPPFSNGNIHMGHALNKLLKDFIIRSKSMSGFRTPYRPGWDNHGMPIESAIIKKNKLDRKKMSVPEFRNACRDFAEDFVSKQREQFMRLGVLGEWDRPYTTMDPKFESVEVRVFGEMYKKGYIYKGKKPVYWCPHDETALAEAEIEYADDKCRSIYVKFAVSDDKGLLADKCDLTKTFFVIWTTTTWTIPGNLAICLNADFTYVLLRAENGETYIVAEDLAEGLIKTAGLENTEVVGKLRGRDMELMTARHPLYPRESVVILGDHVTLEAGTGCVHTAPGHGMEDYAVCRKYDNEGKTNIGVLVPVDEHGFMTEEAGPFAGLRYDQANDAIFAALQECGALLASQEIVHQYPHCWRCKQPIIYRATDQWFCSVEAFRKAALDAAKEVSWTPEWGGDRMESMIRDRADWCISRQRRWGLPIPVFYCSECGKPVCDDATIEAVSGLFAREGSNAWYEKEAADILPAGYACPHCGGKTFTKEVDTLDGWFDSGSTHVAALAADDEACWPSDLYLEGADQYRGWFQSSLLTAVATRGRAPYRATLTHGWVVDGEGKAMHKSLGNSIAPEEIINKYGADLLRLWVASSDYRVDVRVSDAIFKQLSDIYLKIRNTARFILGNLDGFDPNTDSVPVEKLCELDRWALARLDALIEKVRAAYESYEFHIIYHAIHNFCAVDMSSFYLDIVKDRLYCEDRTGEARRGAQTVIFDILDALARMLAPILAFTSEEIWAAMPHREGDDPASVMFNDMPAGFPRLPEDREAAWNTVLRLRSDVNKALELARAEKLIGKPLDAEVEINLNGAIAPELLEGFDLKSIFIVSGVRFTEAAVEGLKGETGVTVAVRASEEPKCARCWTHDHDVNEAGLCPRCAAVVERMA
ncbi:MAG: isoleucine--tRNA ligase [Oscillospiraceae bacterium]|nr:isoleucine--tRNA ligase [Oscillospiraceae bacterium]